LLHLVGNGFFIQPEQAGILAHKALGENTAGELVVLIVFNRLEKARGDLQLPGDVLQIEFALQAFAAQRVANECHKGKFPASKLII